MRIKYKKLPKYQIEGVPKSLQRDYDNRYHKRLMRAIDYNQQVDKNIDMLIKIGIAIASIAFIVMLFVLNQRI